LTSTEPGFKVKKAMKIHRLMQVVFLTGSVCVAVPAFARSPRPLSEQAHPAAPQCGGDSDDDGDDGDGDDDKGDETRLCGGDDGDDGDGDGDDGDDGGGDDTSVAIEL
jgi:hypothetical protein